MKKFLKASVAAFAILCATVGVVPVSHAQNAQENARCTITVTHFRSMNPVANTDFVAPATALSVHPDVRLVDVQGMPTLT